MPRNIFITSMLFIISYFLWGLVPYFETLCREEVGSLAIVIIRFGGSTVLLLSLLLAHRLLKRDFWEKNGGIVKFSFEKVRFKVMRREVAIPRVVIYSSLGILFIVALDFYFLMMRAFSNALAIGVTLSLGLPPVVTTLFEVVFGRFKSRRISNIWRFAVGGVAAIAGIGAATCRLQQPEGGGSPTSWTGYMWVFGFVITWSTWMIIKSRETQLFSDTVTARSFIGGVWKIAMIFASGSTFNSLVLASVSKLEVQDLQKYFLFVFEYGFGPTRLSSESFLSLNMMVLVSTFVAYLAFFEAFARSSKSDALSILAIVLQTFEPLTALLLNVFIWRQALTDLTILGMILVLVSMAGILITMWRLDKERNLDRRQR